MISVVCLKDADFRGTIRICGAFALELNPVRPISVLTTCNHIAEHRCVCNTNTPMIMPLRYNLFIISSSGNNVKLVQDKLGCCSRSALLPSWLDLKYHNSST
jgi:hypothetical protein